MTAREKFEVGDRVRLSAEALDSGLRTPKGAKTGRVTGYGREPQLVRVRWDGARASNTYHCVFIDLDDPGFDPLYLGM